MLEHWRAELAPGWPRFTRRQTGHVEARLAEGFTVDDLKRVALGAQRSPWNRERPHGFNVGTIYGSADAVQTLLAKAPVLKRAPSRGETKGAGGAVVRMPPAPAAPTSDAARRLEDVQSLLKAIG